ncbi:MAG: hypothetical protein ACPGSC_06740, partial [Granulosicoccaceae bacterium]
FFLGLVGSAKAENQEEKQLFFVMSFPEAKLDDVFLPAEPRWEYQLDKRHSTHALILSSPSSAEYPAVLELVLDNRLRVDAQEMRALSASTIAVFKRKLGLSDNVDANSLQQVAYGQLKGWKLGFPYSHKGSELAFDVEVLRLNTGHVITAMSSSRQHQLPHFAVTKGKILSRLKEFN